MHVSFPLTVCAVLALGCGSNGNQQSTSSGSGGKDGSGGAPASSASSSGEGGFTPGSSSGGDVPACDEKVRPIFVLTQGTPPSIYSFDPKALAFTLVQKVQCPSTTGWDAGSMAIDRGYHAWVEWGAKATGPTDPFFKRLDRLDLATGACEPDQGKFPAATEWGTPLGMAFSSDAKGSTAEHLFFMDTSTRLYALGGQAPLGQFYHFKQGEGSSFSGAELTGTGAGGLFTFIMNWTPAWSHPCTAAQPCTPTVHLGEVSKLDAKAISNEELPDVPAFGISSGGFAFAHWGGRFWIFESVTFGPTKVYEYDPVAKTSALVKSDGPDGVVGAGVSTCAPLEIPK